MIESQRKKVWRPKTRTGCLTCRVRRIKCDEGKPHCRRCESTGRKCDGYESAEAQATRRKSSSPPSTVVVAVEPDLMIGTAQEKEAFHFFQTHTMHEFVGFYGSHSYLNGILQASHFQPEIRHALTALGAMHSRYLAGNVSLGVPDNPNDEGLRFAIAQCNRSINLLMENNHKPTHHSKETTLVLSMIYFSLACLQGLQAQSFTHLRAGLEMLGEKQRQGNKGRTEPYPVDNEAFRTAFVGLDTMARSMLPDENLDSWMAIPPVGLDKDDSPTHFDTLDDASIWMENNFNSLLAFTQLMVRLPPTRDARILAESRHAQFSKRFRAAGVALEELIMRFSYNLTPTQRKAVSMLRLIRSTAAATLTILAQAPFRGEEAYDLIDNAFASMVECAARVLGEPDVEHLAETVRHIETRSDEFFENMRGVIADVQKDFGIAPRPPAYSSRFGVIVPMYLVGARCRNPIIRRKAIALLLHYPRREGMWDGFIAGRIALEVMMIEEGSVAVPVQRCADIPEEKRVRHVRLDYTAPREAEFRIRTQGQWDRKEGGYVRFLSW